VSEVSALVEVAREAIRAHLEQRRPVLPAAEGALARRAAVFVTLRLDGELRGCMGTTEPQYADLVAETADRAVIAATRDPRFPPLTAPELEACEIEVTVLGPLEPVDSPAALDPQRFGIEITDEFGRRAVLLPAIEGVDTVERQLALTRHKAGISADAPIRIRRFEATRIAGAVP
jgi:AmmeMemoRadiSam system protein A